MLMPRDLFGDVTDPSISLGTRKWYTVPVSLAVHVVVIAVLVIVPLMAAGALPLLDDRPMYIPIEPPKLPAPPAPRKQPEKVLAANPEAAPIVEPHAIADEPDFEPGFEPDSPAGLVGVEGTLDVVVVAPPPPVVESPAPVKTVRTGGDIRAPERVTYVAPAYPPIALTARVQGMVIIEATIDTSGQVQNARVLRSDSPLFNEPALSAVRQWTYTPTLLNGVPVNVVMTVTVQFRLQ
jgi:protein TonB